MQKHPPTRNVPLVTLQPEDKHVCTVHMYTNACTHTCPFSDAGAHPRVWAAKWVEALQKHIHVGTYVHAGNSTACQSSYSVRDSMACTKCILPVCCALVCCALVNPHPIRRPLVRTIIQYNNSGFGVSCYKKDLKMGAQMHQRFSSKSPCSVLLAFPCTPSLSSRR